MSDKFVHLHNHTEYSFLDGFSRVWDTAAKEPGALIKRLKEIEQEYCAITDHGSTAGWVRFDKSCNKNDIKPIFGVEGYYCNDRHIKGLDEEQKLKAVRGIVGAKEKRAAVRKRENELGLSQRSHFVALAMNGEGLKEINKTLTIASTEGFYFRPRWDWELTSSMKNCIMTSGCAGGIINFHLKVDDLKNGNKERAWEEAKKWKKEFGDRFYIELMAIDWDKQGWIDKISYEIAKDLKIPMIITNDNHYVYPQDCETHDIMLALQSTHWKELETKDVLNDPNRMRYDMQDLYVKTRKEMFKSFRTHHKWIPKEEVSEMLSRTVEIAKRCHHTVNKKKMIMPKIKVPNVKGLSKKYDDWSDIERYFIFLIFKGWKDKIIPHIPKEKLNTYRKRLAYEIKHIKNLGFTPYFILTNRLMKWVDEQGILRGPARGSSAGSLIAYLLDITMIDPIPHKLLFSRFIDPNRTDFPDVDMDFEDTRRREVVQYFIDTYGADKVGILGNNMMFKPKAALKDVARLFKYEYHNMSISEIQEVCNLVVTRSGADSRLSFCLEDTFNQQEFAQKFRKNYPKVCHFAQELEGSVSRQGVHAAGVVISDVDINTYTALRRDKRQPDFLVTFMDKHDAEDIGILKMDVLGLNTMGIISETIKLIEKRYGKKINIEDLCRDVSYTGGDKKVYEAFAKARTEGVFQFMSPGLTRLAKQVHIDNFGEISDATALHRPGPIHSGAMNNYPAFKRGKTKETKKELHPIITKHTKDTYGLIIYQEQVMMIVRELGNFNWEQTNTVRKVMSKSGGAEYFMRTFWPTWKESCAEKGLDEKTALKAFHKIMSFGSWAFNKCISGSSVILNTNPNQYAPKWITVKQLYENNGYATKKAMSNPSCYVKMNTLSIDSDGKLRPGKIKNVFYQGKNELWGIKTESNKIIKITSNHRLLGLEDGEETFIYGRDIDKGTVLCMNGGYQQKEYKKTGEGHSWVSNYVNHKTKDTQKPFKDGRSIEVKKFKIKMLGKPCQRCGRPYYEFCRFEVHHNNRKPPNSKLRWLCNSCHKIEDYELGNRVNQWNKGFPIHYEKVIDKVYLGLEDTYDIEMEDSSRPTFVANGFISHNSHSVSYAMVSYICMWFKVNYPIEFVTAYLNRVTDSTGEKIPAMIMEAQKMGIEIQEPNVNYSSEKFVIHDDTIIAGLSDIKHVGKNAVLEIVNNQPYKGLYSFIRKTASRAVNKRTIENLIKAGAFDNFGYDKKKLLVNVEKINKLMKNKSEKKKIEAKELIKSCKGKEHFTEQEEAEMKNSVSPIMVGKHIVEYYNDITDKFAPHIKLTKLIDIELDEGKQQETDRKKIKRKEMFVIGQLTKVDLKRLSQEVKEVIDVKKEKRYALANFVDGTDFIVLSFKDYVYQRYEQKLFSWVNKVLLVQAECNVGWKKLYINKVWELEELRKYIGNNRKPYKFFNDYLFQHPLQRLFGKRLKEIREKFNAKPLIKIMLSNKNPSTWALGVISDIQERIIKKEKYKGQKMYIVYFEDETYKASFMIYPSDDRYPMMEHMALQMYKEKRPFLLYCQRDYKLKPEDSEFKHITLSIDKRMRWKDVYKTPFIFKGEKHG